MGEELEFTLIGTDPDLGTTLQYSTENLPDGAILNSETGVVTWTPSPGQVGDYVVTYQVGDGETIVEKNALIRVETQPTPPVVNLELTPSFPAVVGQKVTINALADSFTEIETISITVNGNALILDEKNRAEYTPDTTGRIEIIATAIDSAGRSNTVTEVLKVRDTEDELAPVVAFGLGLDGAVITNSIPLTGTVLDTNLDEWNLSIVDLTSPPAPLLRGEGGNSRIGGNVIASGYNTKSDRVLTQFDPSEYSNGFYTLRLEAVDIKGRESVTEIVVEVNNSSKQKQYLRSDTDLSVTLGGTTLDLVRRYDSLERDSVGSFGNGWELGNSEFNLETSLLRGEGGQAVEDDTRVYLTLPNGERVGFTFAPVAEEITGVTYYKPAWVADEGVNYTLESAEVLLSKAGGRYYDLQTAKPYNLSSPAPSAPPAYTLTTPDANVYNLDTTGSVIEQVTPDGTRLIYSDSGILNPATGEMIRFESDDLGRLTKIVAPDGTAIAYSYDDDGNLVGARDLAQGDSVRYSYGDSGLNLIAGDTSEQGGNAALGSRGAGEAIIYNDIPEILPLTSDLGTASSFVGTVTSGTDSELYSFAFRDTEINSTATGLGLLGVDVTGSDELPVIEGLTPVSTSTSTDSSFALFAIESAGLNLLEVNGSGDYQFQLTIAGDVNNDGTVDGVDSGLVTAALGQSLGDTGYDTSLDVNRDGVINATDVQILGSNYGFAFNQAPVVKDGEALTHEDLSVAIPLGDLASDPEGDSVFFKAIEVENGTVTFAPDGETAIFTPNIGYTGTTTFELLADDGFAVSDAGVVEVEVSGAPLTGLDFVVRNPRLGVGEQFELQVIGDFADQEDVLLPGDYLTWSSEYEGVATVDDGLVIGLSDGTTIFGVEKDGLQAVTASRVGDTPTPVDDDSFNLALAEEQGLEIYPDVVTLASGVERQILVSINGEIENPNLLTDGDTGTRYFVDNPNVITVNEDGLITTLDEGEAKVTVVFGATEVVLPVNIESPNLGATILGVEGGIVESDDGYQVMIPEEALAEDVTVDIQSRQEEELNIPIPEDFDFAGGFRLEIGEQNLEFPAQLAIPASEGLEVGTKVFFMREGEIPDETGAVEPIWFMEESGIVGDDGMIRTSSPPWGGATRKGNYSIVVPTFQFNEAQYNIGLAAIGFGTVLAAGGIFIALTLGSKSKVAFKVGLSVAVSGTQTAMAGGFLVATAEETTITSIVVPKIGLPLKTTTEVEINFQPGETPIVNIDLPPLPPVSDTTPKISQASLDFDTEGSLISVTGSNFGGNLDFLKVNFEYGSQTYQLSPFDLTSDGTQQKLSFRAPKHFPISEDLKFSITRIVNLADGSTETIESQRISAPIEPNVERTVTVNRLQNQINIVNTLNPREIVENSNSANLLLARIPIGDAPRYVAATNDASRFYAPLEFSSTIEVIDGQGLRRLDENPDTPEVDRINLGAGTAPSSIVINSDDSFAYIGDRNTGTIYFLNIDPDLERNPNPSLKDPFKYYHDYGTLNFKGLSVINGISRLAINSDGTKLFATSKNRVLVFDIDPTSNNNNKLISSIKLEQTGLEQIELEGLSATFDPNKMLVTNRLDDSQALIEVQLNDDGNLSITQTSKLNLGSTNDYFDLNLTAVKRQRF